MTTARQLTSPIPDLMQGKPGSALSTGAGLIGLPRTATVSKKVQDAILRQRAEDILDESGEAKEFERHYIPRERHARIIAEEGEAGKEKVKRLLKLEAILNRLAEEARGRKVQALGGKERARAIRSSNKELIDQLKQEAGI